MVQVRVIDGGRRLADELWERIEPLLPSVGAQPKGGCPGKPARQLADAIFYVLRTGCQWKALPRSLGAPSTVHDRCRGWVAAGVFHRLLIRWEKKVDHDLAFLHAARAWIAFRAAPVIAPPAQRAA